MSLMGKFKGTISNLPQKFPHGTAPRGIKGIAVDKGERFLSAFAFGAAKGFYGDKFIWKGHGADLWLGAGALLASAFMSRPGGGGMAAHLERVGDAGVMSALNSLGAAWGLDKAGRSVHVSSPGKNALPKASTVLGHLPQAMGGAFLTQDEINRFAAKR